MISEQVETSVTDLVQILTEELTSHIMNPLFVQCFESILLPGYACSAAGIDEHIEDIKKRLKEMCRIRLPSAETVRTRTQPIMEKFPERVLSPLCEQFVRELELQCTRDQFKEKLSEELQRASSDHDHVPENAKRLTIDLFNQLSSFTSAKVLVIVQEKMKKALRQTVFKLTSDKQLPKDYFNDRLVETLVLQLNSCQNVRSESSKKLVELLEKAEHQQRLISKLKEGDDDDSFLWKAVALLARRCVDQIGKEFPGERRKKVQRCCNYLTRFYFMLMLLLSLPGLAAVYMFVLLMFQILVTRHNFSTDASKAFSAFIPSVITSLLTFLLNKHVWIDNTKPQQPGLPVGPSQSPGSSSQAS